MFIHGKRIGRKLYVKTRSGTWIELGLYAKSDYLFPGI
jgi:hypothetical protein